MGNIKEKVVRTEYGTFHNSAFDFRWLENYIIKPYVIIDVGSFDGGDAIRFKERYPNCNVYAFEPNKILYEQAKPLYDLLGIKSYNEAVGLCKCTKMYYPALYNNKFGGGGSLKKRTSKYINKWGEDRGFKYPKEYEVLCTPLSFFCKRQENIPVVDLLHIDAEGSELDILKGMRDVRPIIIYLESHLGEEWYEGAGYSQESIREYCRNLGYVLIEDFTSPSGDFFIYGSR